ncbi:MAG: VWA-like domain-containing protein [Fervidobacterium sp.]|nr:VWA-like domain-containing protein [Fervidobacterium sp.]
MDIRDIFVKALLVGIYNRSDVVEDLFYTALMNKIDIEMTDKVPTAAAMLENLKSKIVVNVESLQQLFSDFDRDQMIILYRGIVKHELMHIYLGHLLLPDKIRIDGKQLRNKIRQDIDLPDKIEIDTQSEKFRLIFNVAADAIINETISEFKKLQSDGKVKLATAEEFIMNQVPSDKPAFCYGTKLLKDCSAEELAAVLWHLLPKVSQSASSQDVIGQDINYVPEGLRDVAEEMWKKIVKEVSEVSNRGLDRISTELRKKLEKKGRINWKQQFRAEIWGEISDEVTVSKHRLSKRTCLPPKIVKRPAPIVLAFVDTSDSISDKLLDMFLRELGKLKADTNAQVKAVMYSINATINKIKKCNDIVTIAERGGTDLANAMKQLPPKEFAFIDSIVVFTDGYDDFPSEVMQKVRARKIFVFPTDHSKVFEEEAKKFGNRGLTKWHCESSAFFN